MSDFFSSLGDVLSSQFQLGENKLRTLDIVKDGRPVQYGRLGKFSSQFDQSAERQYYEEGWQKTDLFNPRPKQADMLMQEPDLTILVKKRAFSSLADNYRTDLMSNEERLFLKATKILFQNKCKQIAAFERLSKIENISKQIGQVDHHLLPTIFAATDTLDFLGAGFDKFKNVVNRLRTIMNLSNEQVYTTWTTNLLNSFKTEFGAGTGVIEFTTALSVNTTTSINFGSGSFNINFLDPYNLMRVTHTDIEQAIADATNAVMGNSFIQLGTRILSDGIEDDKIKLNSLRASRGANPINFIVNPDTFLGKRVRAIIDNSGIEIKFEGSFIKVNVDPAYLRGGIAVGNDGLNTGKLGDKTIANVINDISETFGEDNFIPTSSNSELAIFERIVKSIFNSIQINHNSRTVRRKQNSETNGLRKKMMLHYGGKLIIQPMDVVHIFISSKTQIDNKIVGGLQDSFNTLGFLQGANKAIMNIQDSFDVLNNPSSVEKSLIVGKDFPNWLWFLMRNQFAIDKSGTHVFAGIVKESKSNYGNGFFNVSVSGEDNSAYFKLGVVNFKPALDVFNGSLFDPLTPFDIKFDTTTGFRTNDIPELLPENKGLFNSAFAKYKNGVYVGKKPTINNFVQDSERSQNTSIRRVFYDPDGMVYKWKEGIGTLVLFGSSYTETPSSNTSTPPLTRDPFAGQDVMNTLSLLITGEPYNFATFYRAASQFDNFARDPATGADPSTSYFRNLQTDLKYRNLLYGNFVPFKSLSMDTETYKNILNNKINITAFDADLNDLTGRRANLADKLSYLVGNKEFSGIGVEASNLDEEIKKLDQQIDFKIQQINEELNKVDKPISIVGNDVSLDYDPFLDNSKLKNNLNDIHNRERELRRKIRYLARRLSWKVRANEDVNLFIVDDTYDKDYDIQAFEKSFINPDIFKSDYKSVDEQINHIKDLLDLEVFADTQGHIQVRPPQYNKMPASVFYRMIRLKEEFDIQLYPQFLEDLYVSQVNNIIGKIEIIEDEIRLYGIALNKATDVEMESFLSSQTLNIKANGSSVRFQFISSQENGTISRILLEDLNKNSDPVKALSVFTSQLDSFDSLKTQSTINNIFSASNRANLLKNATTPSPGLTAINENSFTREYKDRIIGRLSLKTTQTFDFKQLFANSEKLSAATTLSQVDLFKILKEISSRIEERQRVLKVAAAALKNAQEGISLVKNKNQIANKLAVPGLLKNTSVPHSFDRLIEDESYDDYGPGSGKRYVIKNEHIKEISISETTPKHTAVEVQGLFADGFEVNLPSDLNVFTNGGNALTTATAVDYDLWRMYGIRLPQQVSAPYLTNPETQCAPFAVALLNKARKEVLKGSATIVGNEYMQPGEVVYLDHLDTLFYVESVNHSFNFGRSFTTNLQLAYGHMPGEYIPTYVDVVGKVLYKNKDITNIVNVRQNNVNNEEHIATLIGTQDNKLAGSPDDSLMLGAFAERNRQALNTIIQAAESVFSVAPSNNYQPTLELRIYYASKKGFASANKQAEQLADAVHKFLVGNNDMLSLTKMQKSNKSLRNFKDSIKPIKVDADDKKEFRSPSSQAYNLAREASNQKSSATNKISAIDNIMHKSIVDCWFHFKTKGN